MFSYEPFALTFGSLMTSGANAIKKPIHSSRKRTPYSTCVDPQPSIGFINPRKSFNLPSL